MRLLVMPRISLLALLILLAAARLPAQTPTTAEIDARFPLGDDLKVLADDVASDEYRRQVLDEMLSTDIAAEWKRVETLDNPESFAAAHGGLEKVLADTRLKAAYDRRVALRAAFLDLMRQGFQRHNKPIPFDAGETAPKAGTQAGSATSDTAETAIEIVLPAAGAERHWPRFRGFDAQGQSAAHDIPLNWTTSENVVWRAKLPGQGNSSPILWGDRIFLTTSGDEGSDRSLVALSAGDGAVLWKRAVPPHEVEPDVRDKNGFASATPTTDGERVVAFFGNGGILCVDFEGRELWRHPMSGFNTLWGTGASPLLYDDRVILIHDQNRAESVCLALDKRTGQVLWSHPREQAMGWATPVAIRVGERDEVIYPGKESIRAYDPARGEELWVAKGPTHEVIPSIVVGERLIYSTSGRQGPTLGIRPGGSGDVTRSHVAWTTVRGGPHVPSPVLVKDRLYIVNDTGIVTCLDALDGNMRWQARLRDKFSASPIVIEGLLYCCAESGKTYIVRPGDKLDVVAENDLEIAILASPAAVGNRLYIRTADDLFCIGKP